MIVRPRGILQDGFGRENIESCIREFLMGAEKRRMLKAYYDGIHVIENRRRAAGMPNNRLSHAFPRYICTIAAGYLTGEPIRYIVVPLSRPINKILS